eukprot:CAMPEP_0114535016 /NCGR_PEP_ID=MMETSP0109-20121206/28168_1 /TAXON_ID=29199 /ORGANISM="Chlorarachnion reptans, Strain CCCM449" /LENGTH=224 /DNA_ID=CAMNT_0001718507 /DNA_START=393 /DNA_END=1067 /DNA_ORIENTATION=+
MEASSSALLSRGSQDHDGMLSSALLQRASTPTAEDPRDGDELIGDRKDNGPPLALKSPQSKDFLDRLMREAEEHAFIEDATASRDWEHGLFSDLHADIPTLCYGCVCPAFLFASTVDVIQGNEAGWQALYEHAGLDAACLIFLTCTWPVVLPLPFSLITRVKFRQELRKKLKIPGSVSTDAFMHLICYPCALLQEYREAMHLRWIDAIDLHPIDAPPILLENME